MHFDYHYHALIKGLEYSMETDLLVHHEDGTATFRGRHKNHRLTRCEHGWSCDCDDYARRKLYIRHLQNAPFASEEQKKQSPMCAHTLAAEKIVARLVAQKAAREEAMEARLAEAKKKASEKLIIDGSWRKKFTNPRPRVSPIPIMVGT